MCRKHTPVLMYTRPDPKTQYDLCLAYALRGLGEWITCTTCGLTGCTTSFGNTRWFTPGKVGYISRERDLAKAKAWNETVAADAASKAEAK